MVLLPVLLFIGSVKFWLDKKFDWMLIFLTAFLTQGYGFIPESVFIIKPYDYVYAFLVIASVTGYMQDKHFFKVKRTPFVYLIYLLLLYQSYEILRTLVTGTDSLTNVIKVCRLNLVYLSFFVLRKIPFLAFHRYVYLNLYFCILQGVIFYLQPLLGTSLLQGRIDEATSAGQITRFANYPFFASFYLFYNFFNEKELIWKAIHLCFWGGMLLVGQSRGEILVVFFTFACYFILQNKLKYYLSFLIAAVVISFVVVPMFKYRDIEGSNSSFSEDITYILQSEDLTEIKNEAGNFTFRIAMLMERWNYLTEYPEYMMTGVGCIHEDSPTSHDRFSFLIGTKNEERLHGYCQIESGDITWVPILLRYGIIGVCIYSLFLFYWLIIGLRYLKLSKNAIYITTSLMGITTSLLSFNTILFDACLQTFFLIFCISYILKYYRRIQMIKILKIIRHQ